MQKTWSNRRSVRLMQRAFSRGRCTRSQAQATSMWLQRRWCCKRTMRLAPLLSCWCLLVQTTYCSTMLLLVVIDTIAFIITNSLQLIYHTKTEARHESMVYTTFPESSPKTRFGWGVETQSECQGPAVVHLNLIFFRQLSPLTCQLALQSSFVMAQETRVACALPFVLGQGQGLGQSDMLGFWLNLVTSFFTTWQVRMDAWFL